MRNSQKFVCRSRVDKTKSYLVFLASRFRANHGPLLARQTKFDYYYRAQYPFIIIMTLTKYLFVRVTFFTSACTYLLEGETRTKIKETLKEKKTTAQKAMTILTEPRMYTVLKMKWMTPMMNSGRPITKKGKMLIETKKYVPFRRHVDVFPST